MLQNLDFGAVQSPILATQEIPESPLSLSTDKIFMVQSMVRRDRRESLPPNLSPPVVFLLVAIMERLNRLRQIADEFDRLRRELPGLAEADRQRIIRETMELTREMACLLDERRLWRRFVQEFDAA